MAMHARTWPRIARGYKPYFFKKNTVQRRPTIVRLPREVPK
eukprot:SAG31_NODE_35903_length_318_cov_1.105023_1_plen_40_part_10